MDRRVQIVRFWTLAVIGLVACCFAPEAIGLLIYGGFAMHPVGLMMPVLAASCSGCTGNRPNEVQIDIDLLSDFVCTNCASYETSYVLPWLEDTGVHCVWKYTIPSPACDIDSVQFWITKASGDRTTYLFAGGTFDAEYFHDGTTSEPCSTAYGPDINSFSGAFCTGGTSTATPL